MDQGFETFAPRGQFHGAILADFLWNLPISSSAKLAYTALCDLAGKKDHCWPSHEYLAKKLGKSVASIKRYLGELKKAGLVWVETIKGRTCKYYLLLTDAVKECVARRNKRSKTPHKGAQAERVTSLPSACAVPAAPAAAASPASPAPAAPVASRAPVASADAAPAPAPAAPSLKDFDAFWAAYPVEKQVRKGAAISAWRKLLRARQLPPLVDLLKSLEGFKASDSWQKDEGRWIPAPCRWLADLRWLDSAPAASAAVEQDRKVAEIVRAQKEREESQKAVMRAKEEEALPLFEAFASRFPGQEIMPMHRGYWFALYSKGKAPLADDVPEGHADMMAFLKAFEKRAVGPDSVGLDSARGNKLGKVARFLDRLRPDESFLAKILHPEKKEV